MKYKLLAFAFLFIVSSFSRATDNDEEIINNMDFFEAMDLLKDEGSFTAMINENKIKTEQSSPVKTHEVEKKQ